MSNSVSLNRKFLIWAAAAIVAGGFGATLLSSSFTHARHHLTNSLVSWATGKSSTIQVAGYELAHAISPHNPSVGLLLAQAQLKQGSADTATQLLSHYPDYLPALQERGEILVQQEDFGQAITILEPAARQSSMAGYWLAIAQSEAGQESTALQTLNARVMAENQSGALLHDLLQLTLGQAPSATVSFSEGAEALSQAQTGILPLALELYRLGLLNTSERVLATSQQSSLPVWVLKGQIALSGPTPDYRTAEGVYYQAYLLDPTDKAVRVELLSLATQLKDQSMINKIEQLQSQLQIN